jgi:polysaccharide chain length determinant protein (PEP-CTERM system associated)
MNGNEAEIQEPAGRELVEYLEIPLRYPRHMWIPFALVLAVAIVLGLVFPRKFRSATLILVEPNKVPDYFVTPMAAEGVDKRLQTIRQVLLSRTRLESVIKDVDPHPELAKAPLGQVVAHMRAAIQIRVQGSDSFSIEYVNRDPKKAARVTNMLADQFIKDTTYLRENMSEQTYQFIESNLEEARRTLEEREGALRRLKQQYWGSLPEQLDTNLRLLVQLQLEQQTLGENLRTAETRRITLERALIERRQASESADPAGSDPQDQLAKLQARLAALRDRYTDEHPDVRAVRLRIARLEQRLADPDLKPGGTLPETDPQIVSLHQALQQVEAGIDDLNTRREKLDGRITELQTRVDQTPRVEQSLTALTRDYQQLKENYTLLLKKETDAKMARKMEEHWQGTYFRILDPAPVPEQPIRPYGLLFLGGGLALGLLAGLASAFTADALDHSIKSVRELESLLPYPVLVVLPRHPAAKGATAT